MGFIDKVRGKLTETVNQHGDKIDQGIDKAGQFVSQRTDGKYDKHIGKGSEHLRTGLDKLDGQADDFPPAEAKPTERGAAEAGPTEPDDTTSTAPHESDPRGQDRSDPPPPPRTGPST